MTDGAAPKTPYLPEMTWTEARDAFARGAIGLLPVGAVEAHGPHLPLGTDVYLSLELSRRVSRAMAPGVESIVLPPITFSIAECAAEFPGTISIGANAFREGLRGVLASFFRHGLPAVALVNSHLEPEHLAALAEVAGSFETAGAPRPRVLLADHTKKPWALLLDEEFRSGECHAGGYETSLLLAIRTCGLVRHDVAKALPPLEIGLVKKLRAGERSFRTMGAADAYCGQPALGTAERGEALYAILVRMWTETIREALRA